MHVVGHLFEGVFLLNTMVLQMAFQCHFTPCYAYYGLLIDKLN